MRSSAAAKRPSPQHAPSRQSRSHASDGQAQPERVRIAAHHRAHRRPAGQYVTLRQHRVSKKRPLQAQTNRRERTGQSRAIPDRDRVRRGPNRGSAGVLDGLGHEQRAVSAHCRTSSASESVRRSRASSCALAARPHGRHHSQMQSCAGMLSQSHASDWPGAARARSNHHRQPT